MVKRKVFVGDSRSGDDIGEMVKGVAERMDLSICLEVSMHYNITRLPKDYDLYVLHLSDVDEANVHELRSEQPYSYFVALRGMPPDLPDDLHELFDAHYSTIICGRDFKGIFERLWMDKTK